MYYTIYIKSDRYFQKTKNKAGYLYYEKKENLHEGHCRSPKCIHQHRIPCTK